MTNTKTQREVAQALRLYRYGVSDEEIAQRLNDARGAGAKGPSPKTIRQWRQEPDVQQCLGVFRRRWPDVRKRLSEIFGSHVVGLIESGLKSLCRQYITLELWRPYLTLGNARPESRDLRAFADAAAAFVTAWKALPSSLRSFLPVMGENPELLTSLEPVVESLDRVVRLQGAYRQPSRGRRRNSARRAFLFHVACMLGELPDETLHPKKTRDGHFARAARVLLDAVGENVEDPYLDVCYAVDEQRQAQAADAAAKRRHDEARRLADA